jgi:hypothetical protein
MSSLMEGSENRRNAGTREVVTTIPRAPLQSLSFSAIFFMVVALAFILLAVWAAVRAARRPPWPLRAGLALILLGLCVSMSYEAASVWQQATTDCAKIPCRLTISQLANGAFNSSYKFVWGAVFLAIIFIAGLLTMHFTRLVQKHGQAEWGLLAAAVLFLTNGALIAFWFQWLP